MRTLLLLLAFVTAAHAQGHAQAQGEAGGGAAGAPSSASTSASVPETQLDRDVRNLAAELRCPVCQGLSLQDSPSELSQEMKDVIRAQLQAGQSPEEVKAYFVSKYGEWILMEPKPAGFNLAVYVLPVLALLAGGGFVFLTARKWVRAGAATDVAVEEDVESVAGQRS